MTSHVPFSREATEEFLAGFNAYRQLEGLEPDKRDALTAAHCVRALYLGLEKGFKATVAGVDPFLLISKPDHQLLVQLRRDMITRPVPSIFCSREPFETLNMYQTWRLLCDIHPPEVDKSVLADFDRALDRLAKIRHRAQHSEFYEDLNDVLSLVEQLLARFREVVGALDPDWLQSLYARNGQLESFFRAIEQQIDGAWQVLLDYITRHGLLTVQTSLHLVQGSDSDSIEALFGATGPTQDRRLLGHGIIADRDASGLFALFLSPDQAWARRQAREYATGSEAAKPLFQTGLLAGLLPTPDPSPPPKPLIPLDPGRVTIRTATGWLSVDLEKLSPRHLFLSVLLFDLLIEFPDPIRTEGRVTGRIESAVKRGPVTPRPITIQGTAQLLVEWGIEGDPNATPPKIPTTLRQLQLSLDLAAAQRV